MTLPEFRSWLLKNKKKRDSHDLAYCKICDCDITSHLSEISRHAKSNRHVTISKEIKVNLIIPEIVANKNVKVKRAELKLTGQKIYLLA